MGSLVTRCGTLMPLSRRLGHPMLLRERLWRLLSVNRSREMRDSEDIAIIAAFTLMEPVIFTRQSGSYGPPHVVDEWAVVGRAPTGPICRPALSVAQAGVEGW